MADELDISAEQTGDLQTPNIAEKATSDLARGRIMLEAHINKLMNSLDRRKNQKFDPVMLRMAQGFLTPTKTGGFGESLGNVAGGVAEEQAKQQAQDEQVGKMQLELQQKLYEMQKQSAAQEMLGTALGGPKPTMAQAPTGAPVGAPMAPSAPVGGVEMPVGQPQALMQPQAPQASNASTEVQQAVSAIKQNPNIMDKITMTPQVVAAISSLDPALGKIAESVYNSQIKTAELESKRYTTNAQGDVWDNFKGEWVEKGARIVEVGSRYDPDRKIPIPADLVKEYNALGTKSNAEYNTWLREHNAGAYAIGAEGAPTSGGGSGTGAPTGKTKAAQELENKLTEKREGTKIEQNQKDVTSIASAADTAKGMMADARTIYKYASNPKTANAFGLISKPGVGEAILSAAEEGIRVGPYNIGVNNLTQRILQAKGSKDEVDAALALGRNIAQLELGYTKKFLSGDGAITEGERAIVKKIPPTLTDSPKTAMLKSEMIMARATFDVENNRMYQEWAEKNPNGYYSQYKNSPSYKQLSKHYDNKIEQLDKKYLPQ